MSCDVGYARDLAYRLLGGSLPRRWSHVAAVAGKAVAVGPYLAVDSESLTSAAWLHDIGYAPTVVDTGFHPLDGARYLRGLGVASRICALVAHHSCALVEAEVRGLDRELAQEFPREASIMADALWFCDMTTGPEGQTMTVEERLNEIRGRYGPSDVVAIFIERAWGDITAAARRTEARLQSAGGRL